MNTNPGDGQKKWGWAPAILFIGVTFALGLASADLIADILDLHWLKIPLSIGFMASEAMVVAWLFEPQKQYYTKDQMKGIEFAKWVVLIGGLVDGVLLIWIKKFGGGVELSIAQAAVTLLTIFVSAGASMWVIGQDPTRIEKIKEATVNMKIRLRDLDLRLAVKEDEIMTKELELVGNNLARHDLRKNTMGSLKGAQAQAELAQTGEQLALGIVRRYSDRVNKIVGTMPKPLGEPRGASEPQQKRRIVGQSIPFSVNPTSGDGAPGRYS